MKLAGARVLLTRPEQQAAGLLGLLAERGVVARNLPLFDIVDLGDPVAHRATLDAARGWDGWIFTSVNAARRVVELDGGAWPRLFATGAATAEALKKRPSPANGERGAGGEGRDESTELAPRTGPHPARASRVRSFSRFAGEGKRAAGSLTVSSSTSASEALLALPELASVEAHRYLLCTGANGRDLIASTLRARGAHVERLELYERVAIPREATAVEQAIHATDAVVVTSGEGLERLWALANPAARERLRTRVLVVPSVRVIELARRLGFPAPLAPAEMSEPGLVRCLEQALAVEP